MTNNKLLWRPALFSAAGEGFQADNTLHDGLHLRWFVDHRMGLPYENKVGALGAFRVYVQRNNRRTVSGMDLFGMSLGGLFSVRSNHVYSNDFGIANTGSRITFWKKVDAQAFQLFWRFGYQMNLTSVLGPLTEEDRALRRYSETVMHKLQPTLVPSVLGREQSEACAVDLRYALASYTSTGQDDPHLRIVGRDRRNRPVAMDWVGVTRYGAAKTVARLRAPGIAAVTLEPVQGRPQPALDEARWILCEDYCAQEDLWYGDDSWLTRFNTEPGDYDDGKAAELYAPFQKVVDPLVAADVIQNQLVGDPHLQAAMAQPTTFAMARYGIDHTVPNSGVDAGEAQMRLPVVQSLVAAAVDPAVARILGMYGYFADLGDWDGCDVKIEADLPFFDPNNLNELNQQLKALSGDHQFDFFVDTRDTLIGARLCALILSPTQSPKDLPWIPSNFATAVEVTDVPSPGDPSQVDLFVKARMDVPVEIDVTQPYRVPIGFGVERRTRHQEWIDVITAEESAPDIMDELGILPPLYFPGQHNSAWDSEWTVPDTFHLPATPDEVVQYRLRSFDIFGRQSPPKEGNETPIPLPCHAPASPANPSSRIVREGDTIYMELTFGLDTALGPLEAPWEALTVTVHRLSTDPQHDLPPAEVQWTGSILARQLTVPVLVDHQLGGPIDVSCQALSWQSGRLLYTPATAGACDADFPAQPPIVEEVTLETKTAEVNSLRTYQIRLAVGNRAHLTPDLYRWCARLAIRGRCPANGSERLSPETCVTATWLMTPPAAQPARPLTAQIPVSTYPDRSGDSYYTLDLGSFGLSAGNFVNVYRVRLDRLSATAMSLVEETQLNDVAQLLALARTSKQPYERLNTLPLEYSTANRFYPIKVAGDLRHYYVLAVVGTNQYGQERPWSDAAIVLFTTPRPMIFPQLVLEAAETYVEAGQPKFRLTCSIDAAGLYLSQVRLMRREVGSDGPYTFVAQAGALFENGPDGVRHRYHIVDNGLRDWRAYEYRAYLLANTPDNPTDLLTSPDALHCVVQAPWGGLRAPFSAGDVLKPQPPVNGWREVTSTFDAGDFDFTLTKLRSAGGLSRLQGVIRSGKVAGPAAANAQLRPFLSGGVERYELTLRDEDTSEGQYILRLSYGQAATWTYREGQPS